MENENKDILSQIQEGRTVSKTLVESANQEILKNKEESLRREIITALVDSEYSISFRKLRLRRARAIEEVEKDSISKTGANHSRLTNGGITPEDWRKEEEKITKETNDALRAVKEEYNGYLQQLNKQSPEVSWNTERNKFD